VAEQFFFRGGGRLFWVRGLVGARGVGGGGIHSVSPRVFLRVVQPRVQHAVVGSAGEGEVVGVGGAAFWRSKRRRRA